MLYYDALIALLAFGSSPKLLWDRWKKKKKNPTLSERFGWKLPDPQGKPVIWIHAVSVGEAKAAQPKGPISRFFFFDHDRHRDRSSGGETKPSGSGCFFFPAFRLFFCYA